MSLAIQIWKIWKMYRGRANLQNQSEQRARANDFGMSWTEQGSEVEVELQSSGNGVLPGVGKCNSR